MVKSYSAQNKHLEVLKRQHCKFFSRSDEQMDISGYSQCFGVSGFFFHFEICFILDRLTPPYMLVLMVYVPLFPYMSNGPVWPQNGVEKDFCAQSWWTNLLYINNFLYDSVEGQTQAEGLRDIRCDCMSSDVVDSVFISWYHFICKQHASVYVWCTGVKGHMYLFQRVVRECGNVHHLHK
ncbi:hypothetical protein KUTeg_001159 [Tegillarca granosa]|uniref:Uncharacterized protein n=1 Tax=Tegillarca granosa TaxID=220873 RepID=A0ABQ9FX44_TEGGR|nr:hypothetical protein KUTeg_001159 [Tegillarca granosa]